MTAHFVQKIHSVQDKIGPLANSARCAMINWNEAPKKARWWAIDANGKAHWYLAPDVVAFTNFWYCDQVLAPSYDFVGDWRESLTERPTYARRVVG